MSEWNAEHDKSQLAGDSRLTYEYTLQMISAPQVHPVVVKWQLIVAVNMKFGNLKYYTAH
jgi:hypothetical protein